MSVMARYLGERFRQMAGLRIRDRETEASWATPLEEILRLSHEDLRRALWFLELSITRLLCDKLEVRSPADVLERVRRIAEDLARQERARGVGEPL